jgi:hypothetical protein
MQNENDVKLHLLPTKQIVKGRLHLVLLQMSLHRVNKAQVTVYLIFSQFLLLLFMKGIY